MIAPTEYLSFLETELSVCLVSANLVFGFGRRGGGREGDDDRAHGAIGAVVPAQPRLLPVPRGAVPFRAVTISAGLLTRSAALTR